MVAPWCPCGISHGVLCVSVVAPLFPRNDSMVAPWHPCGFHVVSVAALLFLGNNGIIALWLFCHSQGGNNGIVPISALLKITNL